MLVITFDQIVTLPLLYYDTLISLKCKQIQIQQKEGDTTIINYTLNVRITHNFVHIIIQVLMLMHLMLFNTLLLLVMSNPGPVETFKYYTAFILYN